MLRSCLSNIGTLGTDAPGALSGHWDARPSAVVDTMKSLSNSICAASCAQEVFQVVIRSKTNAPIAAGSHPP